VLVGEIVCYTDGLPSGHLLYPDVEVSLTGAVGGICQQLSVQRKRWLKSEPGIGRKLGKLDVLRAR
jgi:hypothetical protein